MRTSRRAGRSDVSAYDRPKYDELAGYAADIIEICDALELVDPAPDLRDGRIF